MINALFLVAALAPQPMSFVHAGLNQGAIQGFHAMVKSEEEQIKDWIISHGDVAEVFIHENPQEDKLKEFGWERFPGSHKGKQIWIRWKPENGNNHKRAIGASA